VMNGGKQFADIEKMLEEGKGEAQRYERLT
jgi:hypothetical protein